MRKSASSRTPYIVIGAVALLAIAVRLVSPPPPKPAGPLGAMPNWYSLSKLGDMDAWAVNSSGTMWAGAWNLKTDGGKQRSAVWVIDFEKEESRRCVLSEGSRVVGLGWTADGNLSAVADREGKSFVVPVQAGTMETGKEVALPGDITVGQVATWPEGSANFVAFLPDSNSGNLAIMSPTGELMGKPVLLDEAKGQFGRMGAVSAEDGLFVVGLAQDEVGGRFSYYLGNTNDGSTRPLFDSDRLPGRVEGMWVSPAGVLVICSEREKTHEMVYDMTSGELREVGKDGFKTDVKKNWPDAPKEMKFVAYVGGHKFDLAKAKTTEIFNFNDLGKRDAHWRNEVQDGRLYMRKDGNLISVSLAAGAIDIRMLGKDGKAGKHIRDLLPRS